MGTNAVRVVDLSGATTATYLADRGAWLDNDHLVLHNDGMLSEVNLSSGAVQSIGPGTSGMVSNALGAVAFPSEDDPGQTRVWSSSGLSQPIDGYPVAWSRDGSEMALLRGHIDEPGTCGYLSVVSWPEAQALWSDDALQLPACSTDVRFDPTGRYLGVLSLRYHVVDLASGHVGDVGTDHFWDVFGWDARSRIVIGDSRTNVITAYDIDGDTAQSWHGLGDTASSTADGSSLLFFTTDYPRESPPVTIVSGNVARTVPIKGTADYPLLLAPDGHAVVAFAYDGNTQVAILSP